VVGIALQWRLAEGDAIALRSVRTWTVVSSLGLVAVSVAAFLPAERRFLGLVVAALLDVMAALRAGSGEWRLFPGHFAERHGLFVIIVLGESLIAAGVTATGQPLNAGLLAVAVTAVAGSGAIWWTYFGWVKDALEEAMTSRTSASIGRYARDVYSFAHFPLILGVIGFAVAIEEAIAHPNEPLHLPVILALCLGVLLIQGGTALALRIAGRHVPMVRFWALLALVAIIPMQRAVPAWVALALVSIVVAAVAVIEAQRRPSGLPA
jgi:low temperature requirement protein LtrA